MAYTWWVARRQTEPRYAVSLEDPLLKLSRDSRVLLKRPLNEGAFQKPTKKDMQEPLVVFQPEH